MTCQLLLLKDDPHPSEQELGILEQLRTVWIRGAALSHLVTITGNRLSELKLCQPETFEHNTDLNDTVHVLKALRLWDGRHGMRTFAISEKERKEPTAASWRSVNLTLAEILEAS